MFFVAVRILFLMRHLKRSHTYKHSVFGFIICCCWECCRWHMSTQCVIFGLVFAIMWNEYLKTINEANRNFFVIWDDFLFVSSVTDILTDWAIYCVDYILFSPSSHSIAMQKIHHGRWCVGILSGEFMSDLEGNCDSEREKKLITK